MKLEFKRIEYNSPAYWEAVSLRSKVLREPLNMRFTEEQLEAEQDYIHLAAFQQNRLVSCLYLIQDGEKARLRQFVVEPELHNKGIGRSLLQFMESFCREQGINYIFMHARESAVPFYEKLGYKKYGEKFLEIGLPHWKLHKWL
jgi:GNAT superfamily N-acetyltransferase